MIVYSNDDYPEKNSPLEIDIEEFVTTQDSSGIWLARFVNLPVGSKQLVKNLCVVNYGTYSARCAGKKPVRGIQDGDNKWNIDVDKKILLFRENNNVLYDADKITRRVVFEGTLENIFEEFALRGYVKNC